MNAAMWARCALGAGWWLVLLAGACSHDWDALDPEADAGAGRWGPGVDKCADLCGVKSRCFADVDPSCQVNCDAGIADCSEAELRQMEACVQLAADNCALTSFPAYGSCVDKIACADSLGGPQ